MLFSTSNIAALAVALLAPIATASPISVAPRAAMDAPLLWDNGIIPYVLEGYPNELKYQVQAAMKSWEINTCVKFVPKKNETAWVEFKKFDQGCFVASLGAVPSGPLIVNLDYPNVLEDILSLGTNHKCMEYSTVAHQLGHVLGLSHEHQRPDRDQYINIIEKNVDVHHLGQFTVNKEANISLPFDYNSIMMFDTKAFAKHNWATPILGQLSQKHTMESLTDEDIKPSDSPTATDFRAVNDAYSCPAL